MLHKPRGIDLTQVTEWSDGEARRLDDYLVAEEPLEIRLNGAPLSVTMRTPGNDLELTAGFLLTEGIIETRKQIRSLDFGKTDRQEASGNIVEARLDVALDPDAMQRNFFVASSCGICGKASIDAVRNRGLRSPNPDFRLDPDLLCSFPDKLRAAQTIFGRTGGLHAAGLFTPAGELLCLREDVGRHNAVDKVVGWALSKDRLPLKECALMVSGRGGFEIIQKALAAGLPLVASVSAPSSLAVRLAREFGLTLVGFLRGRRFLVYSGEARLALAPASAPASSA
ncbi:MAG: formate dehydrogenase accessory sulfurtransferase FdhD [Terriglobales bacterium]